MCTIPTHPLMRDGKTSTLLSTPAPQFVGPTHNAPVVRSASTVHVRPRQNNVSMRPSAKENRNVSRAYVFPPVMPIALAPRATDVTLAKASAPSIRQPRVLPLAVALREPRASAIDASQTAARVAHVPTALSAWAAGVSPTRSRCSCAARTAPPINVLPEAFVCTEAVTSRAYKVPTRARARTSSTSARA